MKRNCLSCASRSPIFDSLTSDELELVNRKRFRLKFNPSEIVRKQGAYLSHVIFVTEGLVSIYIEGYDDRNLILKIVKPGQFISGPGMFVDRRHHYTVKAHLPTEACFVEVETIKGLIHTNPVFASDFFRDFSKNMLINYSRLINLSQRYVPGRMAEALIYLSEEVFGSRVFESILSSRELGALAGMSCDSVLKTLREFRSSGIIAQNGNQFEILNPGALKKISMTG
ncbi:MAG: Crp/Fnr family transcriptional regulator [Bacteroidales bacterium]